MPLKKTAMLEGERPDKSRENHDVLDGNDVTHINHKDTCAHFRRDSLLDDGKSEENKVG